MSESCEAKDAYSIVKEGEAFSAEQVVEFEKKLETAPDNERLRTQLLGYYSGRQYTDVSAKEARPKHVLWLIENKPEAEVLSLPYGSLDSFMTPEAYQQGKIAWLQQLEAKPDNLIIIKNAVAYFLQTDKTLAEQSLLHAKTLEPKNGQWPQKLGQIYELKAQGKNDAAAQENSAKALDYYEEAYALSSLMEKDALLANLAKSAFKAGQLDKAASYAQKMLDMPGVGWNSGNNIHFGNIILGHVALEKGNTESACSYLILAGKTKGSPQLNSFGPNFTLAQALIAADQSDSVLTYLEGCAVFWDMDRGRLEKWTALIHAGQDPFSGESVRY